MVEDNGTKENGLNLGRKMELEKESETLEEITIKKMINLLILCHFLQLYKIRAKETRPHKYWKC